MNMDVRLIPIISIIIMIPTLMFLAMNNDESLQELFHESLQKETQIQESTQILETMSHYAEKGFDEICINDGNFIFCAIEQKNWHIWTNKSLKEATLQRHQGIINAGYDAYPLPEKMIKSLEQMGNFTSYYNMCATTITLEHDGTIFKNNNCEHSNQIFLDKLTKHVSINDKIFVLSITPLYTIPRDENFGLDYFLESEKTFTQFIKNLSLQD